MSFGTFASGLRLLPDFLAAFPEISIDLHLSDVIDRCDRGKASTPRSASPSSPAPPLVCAAPGVKCRVIWSGSPHLPGQTRKTQTPPPPHRAPLHWLQPHYEHRGSGASPSAVNPPRRAGPRVRFRVNNGDANDAGADCGHRPRYIAGIFCYARHSSLIASSDCWLIGLFRSAAVYWVTPRGTVYQRRVEVLGDYLIEKLAPSRPSRKIMGRAAPRKAMNR